MHYTRWLRHGDPLVVLNGYGLPLAQRIEGRVERAGDGGCDRWLGTHNPGGYATLGSVLVHRFLFEQKFGVLPEGYCPDHLCGNRWCVNPEHEQAATIADNTARGDSPGAVAVRTGRCMRGHDLGSAYVLANGHRQCRTCRNDRRRAARRT